MKRKRLQFVLALLTAAAGAWAQATATTSATRTGSANTYTVKMKEGTKDAAKWTIASEGNSTTGDKTEGLTVAPTKEVTLKYGGRLKVKSVEATKEGPIVIELSHIQEVFIGSDGHTVTVPNGATLTGTLRNPYKIVIPDGATVTLSGVTIESANNENYNWAGINCEGDATIILADGKTNWVEGFYENWPGIYVPGDKVDPSKNKTLIIKGGSNGSGKLEAKGRNNSAGIGGGKEIACGNIIIEGGNIKAKGVNNSAGIGSGNGTSCGDITITGGNVEAISDDFGAGIGSGKDSSCGDITISGGTVKANAFNYSAGIGSGYKGSSCGDITISGGTVTAIGGKFAAGIGSGHEDSSCGDITITKDVTLVTATKGGDSPNSIGLGNGGRDCGTVTIGCELDSEGKPKSGTGTVYYDGHGYQNGGDVYLAQSTLTLVNLGKLTGNYEAPNGTTLFGTLNGSEQPYKVSIADGATVTLDGVDIEGVNDDNCPWAGLTCAGDATIILNDGSENTVKGFHLYFPGIFVRQNKTLTIKGGNVGNGKLSASPFEDGGTISGIAAGIGGTGINDCGSIVIQGGIISATGGNYSAGIGGSWDLGWELRLREVIGLLALAADLNAIIAARSRSISREVSSRLLEVHMVPGSVAATEFMMVLICIPNAVTSKSQAEPWRLLAVKMLPASEQDINILVAVKSGLHLV